MTGKIATICALACGSQVANWLAATPIVVNIQHNQVVPEQIRVLAQDTLVDIGLTLLRPVVYCDVQIQIRHVMVLNGLQDLQFDISVTVSAS